MITTVFDFRSASWCSAISFAKCSAAIIDALGGGEGGRISGARNGVLGRVADGEELTKFVDDFLDRLGRGEPGVPAPILFWTAERSDVTDTFLCSEVIDALLSSLKEFELGVRRGTGVRCEALGGGGRS